MGQSHHPITSIRIHIICGTVHGASGLGLSLCCDELDYQKMDIRFKITQIRPNILECFQ